MALHERNLVGVDIGCARCARGIRAGTLVLAQCASCHALGRNFKDMLRDASWGELSPHLNQYVTSNELPALHVVYRTLHGHTEEPRSHLFVPAWLAQLLNHGTAQRRGFTDENRLNWPKVLQRCRDDLDFRETLMATVAICDDPSSVHTLVSSIEPELVGVVAKPRKRRTGLVR